MQVVGLNKIHDWLSYYRWQLNQHFIQEERDMKVKELIEKLMEYHEDLEVVIYDEDNDYTMEIQNVTTDISNEVDYKRVALVKR